MRRKSSRNARNSSPEKAKTESQRRSSRRQSSRRRKRSSSRSSDSEELPSETKDTVQIRTTNSAPSTDVNSESDSKLGEKSIESLVSDTKNQEETNIDDQNLEKTSASDQVSEKEDNKDSQEWKEEVEDMEEKKNKGKSKGKTNSNFEQSSNYIEPETENVQGTHQSPSNDNADNENVVQNVNDTETLNPEAPEDKIEDNAVTENEDQQQKSVEAGFVSEYTQMEESSQSNENQSYNDKSDISHKSSDEEKSTASDKKNNNKNSARNTSDQKENKLDKEKDRPEHSDGSGPKKRITLRRSPPENKESEKVVPSEDSVQSTEKSNESKKTEETKPSSKKITLKRHTTDDGGSAGEDTKKDTISRSLSVEAVQRKRRLSSVGDDVEQNRAEKPKKVVKPVKLIRTLSREGVNDEEKTERIALRRQRWGRSDWLNKLTSSFYKVDVESIKIVCPSVEFLGEHEINFDTAPRERRRSEAEHRRKLSVDNRSEDSDRPEYEKQTSEESSGEPKVETNLNIIAMNRKISIVDDTASKLRPPPSPAKNPTSDVLFITNLVRPFTVKQLKELLERTGKIKEEGFWTDRIKSKCYVQYETVEEAEATRNALHGVHWPIGNGKQLVIDYATAEDLEKAKNPAPPPVVVPEKLPEKENREPDDKFDEQPREERRKREGAVREWDVGKEDSRRRFSRSRSRERARKHSRRSYTPEGYINSKKQRKDDAVPQKLMDDLFLKTKATPSIYWQPLSPEEITMKQQQRLVRMEEHKRRIEENRGRAREGRRVPFRRR